MKCSVCGSENLEGSAYCEDCGARLPMGAAMPTQEAPAVAAAPPPPPPAPAPAPEPAPVPAAPPAPVVEAVPAAGPVTCAACGAENPSYEAYCEDCGASLTASRSAAPPTAPVPVPAAAPAAPPPSLSRPRLALVDGAGEFPLEKDEIALGRRSPADGIFPEVDLTEVDTESYVSRRHGKLFRRDGRFLYEDAGSSNGSFVNGTRLQAGVQAELHEGDRLRLGKTEMVFRV